MKVFEILKILGDLWDSVRFLGFGTRVYEHFGVICPSLDSVVIYQPFIGHSFPSIWEIFCRKQKTTFCRKSLSIKK